MIAARIDKGDLLENEAADKLAKAVAPCYLEFSEAAIGRVNIYSTVDGLFVADRAAVDRFNRIDPAITLACLADHSSVRAGAMVATFKITSLAVPGQTIDAACAVLRTKVVFAVKPFARRDLAHRY